MEVGIWCELNLMGFFLLVMDDGEGGRRKIWDTNEQSIR